MKKRSKIIIISILFALSVLLVACGGIDSIFFEKEPKTTYIEGQDFVLDDSVLVALSGKKTEPIDLTQVTVSGYDKDTVGTQTVTVTYGEHSVTLTVTVIARMTFEGVVTDYFVGDSFDKSKGRVKIANDDGKTTTVNLSSEEVTVEGFDSASAGKGKTVTVKYGEFSGSFAVNVFDAENVELSAKPKKNSYYSHETEFATLGAYFTVTANNGALTRMVELTPDMISGFDPSKATEENFETPLNQTVTISYLGKSFEYPITIRYSAVSLMETKMEGLKDVSPETATAEQGKDALRTMEKYLDLAKSEQALVKEETKEKILLVALHYAFEEYRTATESFADAFTIQGTEDEDGNPMASFTIMAKTFDSTMDALERLQDEDEPFITLAETLRSLKEEFKDLKVTEEETVEKYLDTVYEADSLELVINIFEMMTELYQNLEAVPVDWKKEDLINYKDYVKDAVITITNSDFSPYTNASYATLYEIVSTWREKNDFFEIVYTYYMENEPDTYIETLWENVPLPGQLQNLYHMFSYGLGVTNSMKVGTDTTAFMYYYFSAVEIANSIKNGDNELQKTIYNALSFDALMTSYFFAGSSVNGIAYVYHTSSMLDNPKYDAFMEKFMDILSKYLNNEFKFDDADSQKLSEELYEMYINFTPAEQYSFICALHCDYRFNLLDRLVLSYELNEEGQIACYSWFGQLILKPYYERLSEEAFDVFTRLFEATELYALRYRDEAKIEEFKTAMEGVIKDAAALSVEERASFNFALEKFTMLYNECVTPTAPQLTDEEQKQLDELKEVTEFFFELYNYLGDDDVETAAKTKYYALLFAGYERTKILADAIMASESEALINAYLYTQYTFHTDYVEDETDDNYTGTFDSVVDEIKALFVFMLIQSEVGVENVEGEERLYNAFTLYYFYGVSDFMNQAYELMLAEYRGEAASLSSELVFAAMQAFRSLDNNGLFTLNALHAHSLYYDGILHYFEASVTDSSALAWIRNLLSVERAYTSCVGHADDEELLNNFKTSMQELIDSYGQFTDKAAIADFEEMYQHYVERYENINDTEDGPEGEDPDTPPVDPTPTPDEDSPV